MSYTKRLVKGSPLTGLEYDANIDETINRLANKVDSSDTRLTNSRSPTAHNHEISDVNGLVSALAGKASNTTVSALADAIDGLVDTGDTRLTDARPIQNGSYGDFVVSGGVAALDRTNRTLVSLAGYDEDNVLGSMLLESIGDVPDTIDYNNPDGTPGNMTADDLVEWASAPLSALLTGAGSLQWHQAVRTADLGTGSSLSTGYANGQTVGGVVVATGDRIGLFNRTTGSQNGVYVVQATGTPIRATDSDDAPGILNALYLVLEGTNGGRVWHNTNTGSITLGTTALTYAEVRQISKGTDVAAASSTVIGSGDFFHITGTTGITGITYFLDWAGRRARLYFEGAVPITNSGTLITSSGESFTTTAGDIYDLISEGSGTYRLVSIRRAKAILALGNKTGNFTIPILSHHSAITVTLTGNGTITGVSGNIEGGPAGTIPLFVTQDGTGSRTLAESATELTSWGSDALTLVTTAAATTMLLIQQKPDASYAIMNSGRSF